MQAQVTARHFEASPAIRTYAAARLSKLERYYDGITDARVVLSTADTPSSGKFAEITLNVYRQQLSAHDSAASHEEAIDRCVERLRRQVMKYKARLRSTDHYRW